MEEYFSALSACPLFCGVEPGRGGTALDYCKGSWFHLDKLPI